MSENIITTVASKNLVLYWIHYADHCDLDVRQRQSVRATRIAYESLFRARDEVQTARDRLHVNGITGAFEPTPREQQAMVERTKQFFQSFYSTLSEVSGLIARTHRAYGLGEPPTASMKHFIAWLGRFEELEGRPDFTEELERARAFRSVFDHAGQKTPFEWDIAMPSPGHAPLARMYGTNNRQGAGVDGSAPGGPLEADGWEFFAPSEISITNGMLTILMILMPRLMAAMLLPDETNVTCPDFPWEREWNGSSRVHAEPESFLKRPARSVSVATGEVLKDPTVTKAEFRRIHPNLDDPTPDPLPFASWSRYEIDGDS